MTKGEETAATAASCSSMKYPGLIQSRYACGRDRRAAQVGPGVGGPGAMLQVLQKQEKPGETCMQKGVR